ncbi:MAG: hypothetical protein ACYDAP_09365 [Thermoplasmataceae archaeon]
MELIYMANFLDTNLVLDIIYPERTRNKEAVEFYKRFRNYELAIEDQVQKECQTLMIRYLNKFSVDLQNYISANDRHSKKWDLLDQKKRSKILTDFIGEHKKLGQKNNGDYFPFYKSLINLSRHEIIYLNFRDLKEYLMSLPSEVMRFLSEQIRTRFDYKIPYNSIEREDIIKFRQALNDSLLTSVFKRGQRGDRYILVNIIHLLLFGDSDGKNYDKIVLFTYDKDFFDNFNQIKASPPAIIPFNLVENYPEILENLSFEIPR